MIHVKNQVSLGAGETLASKVSFEQWLWEISMARVKHYHSDNGIFASAEFREQCKEDSQMQSFSGVGAQHQNAEAERSIQTVMYMARCSWYMWLCIGVRISQMISLFGLLW
mgnify:CR=1 FL=1